MASRVAALKPAAGVGDSQQYFQLPELEPASRALMPIHRAVLPS